MGEILRAHKNTDFFSALRMAHKMEFFTFLDLTRLLGRVKGSNLVQSVCNTCGDMCEAL